MEKLHTCKTCLFFRADESIKKPSAINGVPKEGGGYCYHKPPTVHVIVQMDHMRNPVQSFAPVRPAVFESDFCRSHSMLDPVLNPPLEYNPEKFAGLGGFQRPPTLAEARRFSPVVVETGGIDPSEP